jgi:hypothetical protein
MTIREFAANLVGAVLVILAIGALWTLAVALWGPG